MIIIITHQEDDTLQGTMDIKVRTNSGNIVNNALRGKPDKMRVVRANIYQMDALHLLKVAPSKGCSSIH